jgi:membrane peptidoglycan carboxypeptidase
MTEQVAFLREGPLHMHHLRAAMRRNLKAGRFAYGGSTVAQQLVKNLFLTRDKNLSRKLEEAIIVWRLHDVIPRRRILELYLNSIEFGPNVFGITRAARFYFNKPASRLTPLQGAFLALLKPSPRSAARFRSAGQTPKHGWWPQQLRHLMERLRKRGYISQKQFNDAAPYVVRFH